MKPARILFMFCLLLALAGLAIGCGWPQTDESIRFNGFRLWREMGRLPFLIGKHPSMETVNRQREAGFESDDGDDADLDSNSARAKEAETTWDQANTARKQTDLVTLRTRLQQYLQLQEDRSHGASLPEEKRKERLRKKKKGNAPQFDLRAELFRMTGTDLTQIDGIDVTTTMTILSEAGWDMSKWKTEHHFVSWLRLCPDNRISGDKIIGKGRLPTNNRVTNALRMAASTLRLSNTYLGRSFAD